VETSKAINTFECVRRIVSTSLGPRKSSGHKPVVGFGLSFFFFFFFPSSCPVRLEISEQERRKKPSLGGFPLNVLAHSSN